MKCHFFLHLADALCALFQHNHAASNGVRAEHVIEQGLLLLRIEILHSVVQKSGNIREGFHVSLCVVKYAGSLIRDKSELLECVHLRFRRRLQTHEHSFQACACVAALQAVLCKYCQRGVCVVERHADACRDGRNCRQGVFQLVNVCSRCVRRPGQNIRRVCRVRDLECVHCCAHDLCRLRQRQFARRR